MVLITLEIEYRDLENQSIYPKEIKSCLDQNMSFSTSQLEQNHQGGDFCLEGKIKRHKMVAPKGVISNDMWMRITRGLDKIEGICEQASKNLIIPNEDSYRETGLYDEIVLWRAVLRHSGMLSNDEAMGMVTNIYGEPLCNDLDDFTKKLSDKMALFWDIVGKGGPLANNMYPNLQIKENLDIEIDMDSDSSEEE